MHKPFYEFDNQCIIEIKYNESLTIKDYINNMISKESKSFEYCPGCQDEVDCISRKSLYLTSDYFIINIDYGKNSLYNKKVEFENYLFVNSDMSKNAIYYNFLGAIFHTGKSSAYGHYFACCRDGEKFYLLNDTQVEVISENKFLNIKNKKDYKPCVIFYEKP